MLDNVVGITGNYTDSERTGYYSSGFYINNFIIDEIPTSVSEAWNFGNTLSDTAIHDRVVRGTNGLLTGNVSASYGSWNNQRYVTDLSAPLTESGNVCGRIIAGYQDQDSWLNRYHKRKKFISGIVSMRIWGTIPRCHLATTIRKAKHGLNLRRFTDLVQ
ncbi:MAG: hypothetical protein ACSLEN_06465 [Candidatus Malihini olakiniferum]